MTFCHSSSRANRQCHSDRTGHYDGRHTLSLPGYFIHTQEKTVSESQRRWVVRRSHSELSPVHPFSASWRCVAASARCTSAICWTCVRPDKVLRWSVSGMRRRARRRFSTRSSVCIRRKHNSRALRHVGLQYRRGQRGLGLEDKGPLHSAQRPPSFGLIKNAACPIESPVRLYH